MSAEAFEAEYAVGRTLDLAQVAMEARPETPSASGAPRALASDDVVKSETASALTPRELDVLKLLAQGLSNYDIAQRLVLSEHTVHRHLANIYRKLNLSSRTAAAAWCLRAGLV